VVVERSERGRPETSVGLTCLSDYAASTGVVTKECNYRQSSHFERFKQCYNRDAYVFCDKI